MSRRWDLDLLQRSYVGASVSNGVLQFNPRMVDRLEGLGCRCDSGEPRCG